MTGLDRRFLPALASVLILAIVLLVHTLVFEPLAARYHRQLAQSGEIAASLDPSLAASPIPMPVQDLLMDNSVEASDAARLAESGELATDLVKRIADASDRAGLEVAESTPGTVSQTAGTLEVRAHVRLRGDYAEVITLLDTLARDGSLYRLDRFNLASGEHGRLESELWVARLIVKRGGSPR